MLGLNSQAPNPNPAKPCKGSCCNSWSEILIRKSRNQNPETFAFSPEPSLPKASAWLPSSDFEKVVVLSDSHGIGYRVCRGLPPEP